MKRWVLFMPLALALVMAVPLYIGLNKDPSELPSMLIGQPFPAFQLADLYEPERIRSLADVQSKHPYLVNIWATWCPSCNVEHEQLNQIASAGYRIIGLNYKDNAQAAKQWLKKRGNPYAFVLFDQLGKLVIDLGVYGAPETFVVGREGKVLYRHTGILDKKVWEKTLKPLLDQQRQTDQEPQSETLNQEALAHD